MGAGYERYGAGRAKLYAAQLVFLISYPAAWANMAAGEGGGCAVALR